MLINSSNLLFMSMTIMGVMVSFSSSSWLMMWIGMEISVMSFIPLVSIKSLLNSEFSIKYFIVQSISSMLIISSLIMMLMSLTKLNMIMLCSLVMKMGGVPFHNWVTSTIDGLTYESIFILLIIMKIGPLVMISYLNMNLNLFVIMSLVLSSINGINQSSIKKMLTFSSIYNLGLMMYLTNMNSMWIIAMVNYSLILMSITFLILKFKMNYINQFIFNDLSMFKKMLMLIPMLSLGGLPPMMGFQIKMMVFESMINNNDTFMLLILILSSLIIFFFYLNLLISMFMFSSLTLKFKLNEKMLLSKFSLIIMLNTVLFFPLMMTKFMV
uniref:NADH dehydrogenase subunit 2 n=1 Tax=Krisna nigromarginata TaxID=1962557 RepID=UPI002551FEE2|nr:NADH dehydrogenase subunit 2 [Krisna nigromarginata]WGG89433.1 NADH dehydrogenase subunit 2 [Krisna nigromarginata]